METVESRDGTSEPGDVETVRLLKQRRPEGLRLLLECHAAKVRWFLRREFGALNEIEVDEVINLAAQRVWSRADTYQESRGTLRAWFYKISRNCALSLLRRESRQRPYTEVEDWDHTSLRVVRLDPQKPTAKHERFINDLRLCIKKLTPLQKSVINADLRSGDVANAEELARTHGTSKNSIYASRSIARKTLKRELLKLGHSLGEPTAREEG